MTHIEFTIPARGLIGLRTRLMNATSGEAIMHHNFYDYQPVRGSIPARINGVMISTETGRATPFALDNLQERGILFIGGGEQVYEGQIVGEHCRDNDLPVNVCREKKLTNMRAAGADKSDHPQAAAADDAGAGAGVHRGRRVGRGDAEGDPAAQDATSRRTTASASPARPSSRKDDSTTRREVCGAVDWRDAGLAYCAP